MAAGLAATLVPCRPAVAQPRRPNLLVIITDQQQAAMMSCTGNRYVNTPALDRLAAGGTRFERAYPTNPVCIPSRVSMVSGYLPSRFGMRSNDDNGKSMPEEIRRRTMGWILRGAGYETVYGGKTHWLRGMNPESVGFKNISSDQRDGLATACVRFLQKDHPKPFLLVASFINPHDICYMAIDAYTQSRKQPAMYPRSRVERQRLAAALARPAGVSREEFFRTLCPPLPANFEVPPEEPECITTEYLDRRPFRLYVRQNWSPEDWRMHRWAYRRLTEMVDAQIGRLLEGLRRAGLEEQTVVIFTSDHGDLNAAHRLEHKSILYEEAARVPLVVRQKGVTPPASVDEKHLVSVGLDLIPTLCDYAGIDPPAGLLGHSFRRLAEGKAPDQWRDQVVVESRAGRMLRTDRYKYNVYENGRHREQLIDLENDPGEMVNLAEDPKYADVLEEHRRRLRQWVETAGDEIGRAYVPDNKPGQQGS